MSHEKLEEFFSAMAEQHHMAMGEKEHICKSSKRNHEPETHREYLQI